MHTGDRIPRVAPETPLREVIVEMTAKKLGMTTVLDAKGALMGILTDGDLRRALDRRGSSAPSILDIPAQTVMTTTPVTLDPSTLASDALTLMESRQITSVVVVHADRTVAGVLHIHDLLRAGVL